MRNSEKNWKKEWKEKSQNKPVNLSLRAKITSTPGMCALNIDLKAYGDNCFIQVFAAPRCCGALPGDPRQDGQAAMPSLS